jgi:hypothetical protein
MEASSDVPAFNPLMIERQWLAYNKHARKTVTLYAAGNGGLVTFDHPANGMTHGFHFRNQLHPANGMTHGLHFRDQLHPANGMTHGLHFRDQLHPANGMTHCRQDLSVPPRVPVVSVPGLAINIYKCTLLDLLMLQSTHASPVLCPTVPPSHRPTRLFWCDSPLSHRPTALFWRGN